MGYSLGKFSTKNLGTVKCQILVDAVKAFIKESPMDFGIRKEGGLRTAEEQNELFKKGRSQCDGYKKISYHQSGLAVDLVPWVNGKWSWEIRDTFYLAGLFKHFCIVNNIVVESGADWNEDGDLSDGWDPVHWEYRG